MAQRHSFNLKVNDNDICLTAGGSLITERTVLSGTRDSNSSLESRGKVRLEPTCYRVRNNNDSLLLSIIVCFVTG